jgi:hypothetical protein
VLLVPAATAVNIAAAAEHSGAGLMGHLGALVIFLSILVVRLILLFERRALLSFGRRALAFRRPPLLCVPVL